MLLLAISLLLTNASASAASPPAPLLRLAAFTADVTTPIGHGMMGGLWLSKSVADPLEANGFVLRGDETASPDDATRALIERLGHVAAIAIDRRHLDDEMRALTARIEAVREEERTDIAREIHDELGQVLTGLKMEVTWLAKRLKEKPLIDKTDSM